MKIDLYESNGGHLAITNGTLVFTGLEIAGEDFFEDASCWVTGDWDPAHDCDPIALDELQQGWTLVARYTDDGILSLPPATRGIAARDYIFGKDSES